MNMGFKQIDPSDLFLFDILSNKTSVQENSEYFGDFENFGDETGEVYHLDKDNHYPHRKYTDYQIFW